mmetsp:Transcript_133989/g.243862  ORF Transcript_133989/g.243862 Transcript_133989/m.243862 type:complete len:100 (-) Transcript_133989:291-590(-)
MMRRLRTHSLLNEAHARARQARVRASGPQETLWQEAQLGSLEGLHLESQSLEEFAAPLKTRMGESTLLLNKGNSSCKRTNGSASRCFGHTGSIMVISEL